MPAGVLMKLRVWWFVLSSFILSNFALIANNAIAASFKVGETVFVAYPAGNIKDDAFIVGKINQILPNGNYQLAVMDYVEGHDYGVSCVPMVKHDNQALTKTNSDDLWEMWTDTTKLNTQQLDYQVPKENVLKLGYGKTYFIERNNLYIVFGRWLSGAPMLNADRIDMAIKTAKLNNLEAMQPAFKLAKIERKAFYAENGRPLYAFETIKPLVEVMKSVEALFKKDPELKKLWFERPRNWELLNNNTRYYFLVQAIDKLVEDAWNQSYEEGLDRADAKDVEQLKQFVKEFKR